MNSKVRAAATSWNWLLLLCTVAFFNQTVMNMARPVTTYKLIALGFNEAVIGIVAASYAVVPLLIALPLGRRIDRTGNIKFLVALGMLVTAAGVGMLWLVDALILLILAFTLLGLGQLVFTIAGQAAVARYTPSAKLDSGFGWFTAAFSAGQLAGPLLAGLVLGSERNLARTVLLERADVALLWSLVLSVIAIPIIYAPIKWSRATPKGDGVKASEQKATLFSVMKVPGVTSHLVAALALLAILDILTSFLPLVGEELGVSPQWVGVLLALRAASSIASRFLLPTLSQHFKREHLIIASLLISAVGITAATYTLNMEVLSAALMIIGGFFLGLGQPITMTLITQAVPSNWRSTALAVRLLGNRAGQVVLPLAAGTVAASAGPAAAIVLSCVLLAGSGVEKMIRSGRTPTGSV